MALTTRLEFRQSQALVMTPQLMQAIKLLQLSNLDLMAYVEEELEKNPLLERVTDDDGPTCSGRGRRTVAGKVPTARAFRNGSARISPPVATPSRTTSGPGSTTSFRKTAALRSPRPGPRMRPRRIRNGRASDRAAARTANTISKPSYRPSGRSRIISPNSSRSSVTDPVRRMIGQHLIDMVDEAGYLSGDLAGGGR